MAVRCWPLRQGVATVLRWGVLAAHGVIPARCGDRECWLHTVYKCVLRAVLGSLSTETGSWYYKRGTEMGSGGRRHHAQAQHGVPRSRALSAYAPPTRCPVLSCGSRSTEMVLLLRHARDWDGPELRVVVASARSWYSMLKCC
eukprot:2803199-Rhodomonas_salina.1